ncbi:MBL fold metallo-hydrolase [Paenibacillus thermotolerans]|uniref:MBL fold metallo-hydrolase n=1 Tax=Paenibacillus thermotolerans TaxID=3027807 RepID=UPI00236764B3|nr:MULTISPECIES: MBL fold metallo-hydrolase [unclassified Paenibacillus]
MRQLSEHLFLYQDTCNVYVIKSGAEAVLVDFGDGGVLGALHGIGVERVSAVLMTHHHRDQGQGLPKAEQAGIPIRVPHAEQELFSGANEHWQARQIYNNYNVGQDRFSLLHSVSIAGTLKDYSNLTIGGHTFCIVPTPGHTIGSITVMADIDGRRVAFTGDLIAAPGKVWSMAATQWTYNGAEGAAATVASLLDLKDRRPDVLLPSHGEPMEQPEQAVDLLVERLWELLRYRRQNPRLFQLREKPYENVTPHLLKSRASFANYYVLLSESGKALLIDFGYDFATGIPAGTDRASRRPWLYSIPKLKADYGVTSIDAVLLTHYHDDHVAGCNLLRDVEGTQVWAAESFADVLERPDRYDVPCLWHDPIPVDRKVPLHSTVRWEEYEFTLYPLPGHTLYAVAIYFETDGKRVVAGGDQYQGDDGLLWNYVYQNRFRIDDYRLSAELYRKLQPDVIITGHWEPLWVEPPYFEELKERGEALARLHRELLPLEAADFGAEGLSARMMPYQMTMKPGETASIGAEIANPFAHEETVTVRLIAPDGWQVEEQERQLHMKSNARETVQFDITAPEGLAARRVRVAIDMTAGETRFGQQAEALITVQG